MARVIEGRDYTGPMIRRMPFTEVTASTDGETPRVRLFLHGTPPNPEEHVDGGQTWGYEVDLSFNEAEALSAQLHEAGIQAANITPEEQLVRVWVPLVVRVAAEPGDNDMAETFAEDFMGKDTLTGGSVYDAIKEAIEPTAFYLDTASVKTEVVPE